MMLGGRAAEAIIFDEITTGAANDLKQVTDLARRMVTQFGMSERIGQLNFGDNESQPFLGYSLAQNRHYSEETAAKIDEEVHRMISEAYDRTYALLKENEDKLTALAEALLETEIIEQSEMFKIIGMTPDEATPERVQLLDEDGTPAPLTLLTWGIRRKKRQILRIKQDRIPKTVRDDLL